MLTESLSSAVQDYGPRAPGPRSAQAAQTPAPWPMDAHEPGARQNSHKLASSPKLQLLVCWGGPILTAGTVKAKQQTADRSPPRGHTEPDGEQTAGEQTADRSPPRGHTEPHLALDFDRPEPRLAVKIGRPRQTKKCSFKEYTY